MSEVQVREKWGSAERERRWKQTCNNCMLLNINELKQSPQKKCFEISVRSQKDLRKPEISMRSHFKCEISVKSQKYN